MDREWMRAPRWSSEYDEGLHNFIEFAFARSAKQNRILCPCRDCGNNYWVEANDVRDHLISIGFMDGYSSWIYHGEGISSEPSPALRSQSEDGDAEDVDAEIDPMEQMLMEGFGMYDAGVLGEDEGFEDEDDTDAKAYYKLVQDGSQELYPGCKTFSKLQFLIRLLRMKNRWRASNGYFDELLPLIKDALPEGEVLPKNFHEAKQFVKAIGIGYHCIDACRNDCILYRKKYADANSCPVCKSSRWKSVKGGVDGRRVHKVAAKVVRHFPLKRRLQRCYFDPDLSRRQNISNGCCKRIPAPQWEWLVNYWTSNAGQLKSQKNKAIRALQLNGRHTTGSRSNAVVLDQMELKEGRLIGRAELFVETHTTKDGQPIDDYSLEKIDEIRRRFEEDPSLAAEDTHDNDLFSTLFPKERSGRRTGLGLLAGGVGSARISEALFDVQEVKEENKKLWDVVNTLMSNQTKLEQQYNELKGQVSASQTCLPTERDGIVTGQHLHDKNGDNQGSVSHSNRRHGVEPEDTRNAMIQRLQKIKRETVEQTLLGNDRENTPPQSLPETSKKPRRFQTPLHKDEMEDMKCGMEVGLASPNSNMVVALGTIQRTDRKAKAKDGQPLADYIEVLVSIVYKQTTKLPRAHGKIQNLGTATAHCIPWPRQNIICSDLSQLQSKFCSSTSQIAENKLKQDKGQIDSQKLTEGKTSRRKVCKEKPKEATSSKIDQSHTSNIHITTSRC